MHQRKELSPSMSPEQFERGYWYAVELKRFAKGLGVPKYSKLRKDELEDQIIHFLTTGQHKVPDRKMLSRAGTPDSDSDLRLETRVVNYTNNSETKDFLEMEARSLDPNYKRKSGARYRLNRWREEQLEKGARITYGDLVRHYVGLSRVEGAFPRARSGRYVNFLSDYSRKEEGASRKNAVAAWQHLKRLDIPKNYQSWKKHQSETE